MKKSFVTILVLLAIGVAHADKHERGRGDGGYWLGPVIIGGILGYGLAQLRAKYVQPALQPVVLAPKERRLSTWNLSNSTPAAIVTGLFSVILAGADAASGLR
ncbi:hypothetical protein GALLN_00031 [Gallionellaceae bacterium]|nr:hypothetical protein GALLN_00031 [Gallionellaceae bacterium]